MPPPERLALPAHPDWIRPEGLPRGVGALMTTRHGGVSAAPWASMNVGNAVGDDAASVGDNRHRLAQAIRAEAVFLRQVHGTRVLDLDALDPDERAAGAQADAAVTTVPGRACTVQVADCLPVLFAASNGRAVGSAHAGWRGLAGGVLEATVRAVCERADCPPQEIWAWMGPCIGPRRFEVGADVLAAFGATDQPPVARWFEPAPSVDGVAKWHAHLAQLARLRLSACGVTRLGGGTWCTFTDASRFFSYRRDRVTGRMVGAIWLLG